MRGSAAYRIAVSAAARADLHRISDYSEAQVPHLADRWLGGLVAAIDSLAVNPGRCGIAPETAFFDEELRHLIYGRRRRSSYRIVFRIDTVARVIEIVRVLHGAQDVARPTT